MIGWYKIQVWILTVLFFCLYFWMLLSDGKIPEIEQKVSDLDNRVQIIESINKMDTIVILHLINE